MKRRKSQTIGLSSLKKKKLSDWQLSDWQRTTPFGNKWSDTCDLDSSNENRLILLHTNIKSLEEHQSYVIN